MHNIVTRAAEDRVLTPPRPVFCSEGYYDVADDADQAYHARWQVWSAMLNGCAGYGHGAHGIWQFYDPADLTHLRSEGFHGQWFDPRTAEAMPLGEPPNGQSEWLIPQRPSPVDEDWVLCLEKRP